MRPFPSRAAGTVLLLLLQGYLAGRIVDNGLSGAAAVTLAPDTRPPVATLHVHGIRNGYVEGEAVGDIRFFLGEEQVLVASGGTFRVPAEEFLRNHVRIVVPPGMQFVASKNGKKYYPVASASGERIVPRNRVYFGSAEEAERAGYER